MLSILFSILLFSLLVFVHELGHFLTAKAFGVKVNEFSVFMGPALWKKQIGETLYAIRLIPFGGFCAMEGEDGGSDDPRAFFSASWWKKLIILVAGATVNFVVGVILVGCVCANNRYFVLPVVETIEDGSALAGEYGIQEGDRILELDGEKIYLYSDFSLILSLNGGDVHDITLLRDGEKLELRNFHMEKREFTDSDGTVSLRYGFSFSAVESNFAEWLQYTWNTSLDYVRYVRLSLAMLLSGQAGLSDISGPVGIVSEMSEVAESSGSTYYAVLNLLNFGGLIAINLAVMNLLPLPALDGGRALGVLLTAAAELVAGKKIDPKYEGYIHAAGMVLLLSLMALIMCKDIFVLIRG